MTEPLNNQTSSGPIGHKAPQPRSNSSGRITETIGTGENAKNSIVWMTITWSFFIASVLSLLFFALVVAEKNFNYLENIKSVWSIFIPIITLALGYAFGKSK
jgi:hypothetical protein